MRRRQPMRRLQWRVRELRWVVSSRGRRSVSWRLGEEFSNGSDLVFDAMEGRHSIEFVFCVRVESERSEDGCEEVLFVESGAVDIDPIDIGCAGDNAPFEAASGHHHAPRVRVMVTSARYVDPRGATELAHGDDESGVEESARFEVVDEVEEYAVEFGHEHLVDFVLEDVVVPVHSVGDHDKWSAVFDEVPRHEGVLCEAAWTVPFAVFCGETFDVEEVSAGGEAFHPLKGGVLTASNGAGSCLFEPCCEELAECFARFSIVRWQRVATFAQKLGVVAAESDGAVF